MAVLFRTAGAWGPGKGANLTPAEVDGNFWDILVRLVAIEENPIQPNEIVGFNVIGTQFTVLMADASVLGPYDLPVAAFSPKGAFAPETTYQVLDLFYVVGYGSYLVMQDHEFAAGPFDPAAMQSGNPLYSLLMPWPMAYELSGFIPGQPGSGLATANFMFVHTAKNPFWLPAGLPGAKAFFEIGHETDLEFRMYSASNHDRDYEWIGAIHFAGADPGGPGSLTFPDDYEFDAGDRLLIKPNIVTGSVVLDPSAEDLSFAFEGTRGTILV